MEIKALGRRAAAALAVPAGLLGMLGAVILWLWLVDAERVQLLLAAAILTLTTVAAVVWELRLRAARKWNAVLDAYVARELARSRARRI